MYDVEPGRRGLLVTGGVSGIGRAVALRLARTHAPVVLLSRHATDAREAIDDTFAGAGLELPLLVDADVGNHDAIAGAADGLRSDGVDIRTVVASAGIAVRKLALDTEDAEMRAMLDTNVCGVFNTFRTLAPIVLDGPDGRFIAISSMSAIHGQRLRAVYAATKAAVSGLVRALATEWSTNGATVNAVAPGILRTPLTSGYMDEHPEQAAAALSHSLVGRLGTVEDVAFTVEYLASPENSYMTGQSIVLDGGTSAGSTWW